VIAMLGNLSRDFFPGEEPRPGGGPYHAARALHRIDTPARIYARCAVEDREQLVLPVVRLGTPVHYVPGERTTAFELAYTEDGERDMAVRAVGDTWLPDDVPELSDAIRWLHVAPLLRSDFPAATLARLARGRRVLLDAHGLVRVAEVGPLRLDADYDPDVLNHVWALKLSDQEAEVLGDPGALPVREVLLTHGARGSTIYVDGVGEAVGAWGVDADPTGAGDAFAIAYVAARADGFPPVAAARRATSIVADMLAAA
jgi:sugar/nucleoside kinase (ribokinase family)